VTEETNEELFTKIGRKFAIILGVIFLFDSIIDLLLALSHLLLVGLHFVAEFFEYTIELLLGNLLGTSAHEGEIILVNIVILVALYGLVRFCHSFPKLYSQFKRTIKAAWLQRKRQEVRSWNDLSLEGKIKVSIAYVLGSLSVLFVVTL